MAYAIYIITNIVNAKQYIGITNDLARRWSRHRGANEGQFIHRAIKKHGVSNFVFTHFADAFDAESAKVLERMLIAEHNTLAPHGYNLTAGGDGTFGKKLSAETKEKIRKSNKDTWSNPVLREKNAKIISKAKLGIPNGRKGIPNGRKGIPQSKEHAKNLKTVLSTPEYRLKRSIAAKEKYQDPTYREAQSIRAKASWVIRRAKLSAEKETP